MKKIRMEHQEWLAVLMGTIIIFSVGDMLFDLNEGASWSHFSAEIVLVVICFIAIFSILKRARTAESEAQHFSRQYAAARDEAVHWRAEASALVKGMSEAIDRQFTKWQLTEAEKEVGFLLLKGLSFKEASEVRGTSERTVRQQAQVVYSKAGVAGRAEFAAFFLEDLLVPASK